MNDLRWYQSEALLAVWNYYAAGNTGHVLICLPTGTGKSRVIAAFIRGMLQAYQTQRFLVLTHVHELIEQDAEELAEIWPGAPFGIHSASLGRRDVGMPIIFGGVATAKSNPRAFGHIDFLFIDEAHLINVEEATMYRNIIEELVAINPYLKVIGLTATPFRLKHGMLTDSGLFNTIVYNLCTPDGFDRLIKDGYLVPPISKRTVTEINADNVKIIGGEYNLKQLQETVNIPETNFRAMEEALYYGQTRESWLAFCSGIEHAEACAETLRYMGISAEAVHSKLKKEERRRIIAAFKDGRIRCVTNNNVLTTGFNHTRIDLILMMRPTVSPGLWVQMLGRGTRPAPGKTDCLVLDFVRNSLRLGPIDDPRIPTRGEPGTGELPVKICDACGTYNHPRVRFCVCCGAEFSFENKIARTAVDAPLLSFEPPKIEFFDVWHVVYSRHLAKKTKLAYVRVSYYTVDKTFNEYITFDAPGGQYNKAAAWWRQHMATPPPLSTDLALAEIQYSRKPRRIKVAISGKYPEVLGREF